MAPSPLRLAALLCLFCAPALAHDLWLERDAAGYTLYQGHRHASHRGTQREAYSPATVKSAACLDAGGKVKPLVPGKRYPVRLAGTCEAVSVDLSTGYWTKTAWGISNAPKTGNSGVIQSWLSEGTLKRIDHWTSASARPLGTGLEITPSGDPFGVAPGGQLTVLVTDNQQPKAGVPVAYHGAGSGVTDADGKIAIRISHGGTQLISAKLATPLGDGKADTLLRAAALQFELPP